MLKDVEIEFIKVLLGFNDGHCTVDIRRLLKFRKAFHLLIAITFVLQLFLCQSTLFHPK